MSKVTILFCSHLYGNNCTVGHSVGLNHGTPTWVFERKLCKQRGVNKNLWHGTSQVWFYVLGYMSTFLSLFSHVYERIRVLTSEDVRINWIIYVKAYCKPKLIRQKRQHFEDMAAPEGTLSTLRNRKKVWLVIQHQFTKLCYLWD